MSENTKTSFSKKLIISLVSSQVLFLGLLMILGFYFVDSTIEGQFNKRITAFSLQLESSTKTAMISYDLGTLNSIGQQAMSLADMAKLQIYLADTLVVNRINSEHNLHEKVTIEKDIFASGQRLGKFIFSVSKDQLISNQKKIYFVLFFICLFEFVSAVIISFLIGNHISKKTNYLIDGINKYAEGDLSFRYEIPINDEFGFVAKSFNEMTQKMNELRIQNIQNSKMAALGEMAGSIAHEINNPLTVINSLSSKTAEEFRKETQDVLKITKNLEKISSMSKRIAKIISGLRTFSRNADSDPLEEIAFSKLLEDSLSLCSAKFSSKNVKLIIEILINKEQMVLCRETQISQVIINLLSNALDAVENLPDPWVKIEAKIENDLFVLSVTDCGKEVSKEVVAKMMEPFFTTKPVGKGTGLGLSISKGIIEGHNGVLYFDEKSLTTRFVIEIPINSFFKIS